MPSPRPPGSGVEKILVSSHKIPKDHILHLIVFTCRSSEPRVGLFASRFRLFFFLDCSSPSLSLALFRAPLSFLLRCPAISGEVSHFVTIIALHLGGVSTPFSLCAVVSVLWGKGGLLILLVPRGRFVIGQCKPSLYP